MPFPSIVLSILIGGLIGSLFHVFVGGGRTKLGLYILIACLGFFAGHFIGIWRGWLFGMIGALDVGNASLFSILFLAAFYAWEKFDLTQKNGKV